MRGVKGARLLAGWLAAGKAPAAPNQRRAICLMAGCVYSAGLACARHQGGFANAADSYSRAKMTRPAPSEALAPGARNRASERSRMKSRRRALGRAGKQQPVSLRRARARASSRALRFRPAPRRNQLETPASQPARCSQLGGARRRPTKPQQR